MKLTFKTRIFSLSLEEAENNYKERKERSKKFWRVIATLAGAVVETKPSHRSLKEKIEDVLVGGGKGYILGKAGTLVTNTVLGDYYKIKYKVGNSIKTSSRRFKSFEKAQLYADKLSKLPKVDGVQIINAGKLRRDLAKEDPILKYVYK
jgi:hypothetical protein